jgi:nucleotide-binding universal stress UspA family protein
LRWLKKPPGFGSYIENKAEPAGCRKQFFSQGLRKPARRIMYSKILVPLDGSPTAWRGVQEALVLAKDLRARLVVLHVVDDYPMMAEVASAEVFEEMRRRLMQYGEDVLGKARRQAEEAGVPCECVLRETPSLRPFDVIVEEANMRRCDLIVMGTHGRKGLSRLALGSNAEMVVRESPVPVLLVRQHEQAALLKA